MGQATLTELRIYCICGQKMRVSESMFGLPGKCVACRQKIRVPFRNEIPPDTTEIHLKDHPELLRKARPELAAREEAARGAAPVEEPAEVSLGESIESSTPQPLDICEPLRALCSIEHKIARQLDTLTAGQTDGVEANRAALEGYLKRVRDGRAGLDDELRQRLMEVAIELASTQEKIIQAGLSARIGEMEFSTFRDTVDRLRHRREYLERLQENLRAWLAVDGPHAAGGYTNVSFDAIPSEGVELILPPEPFDPRTLFDIHIDGLRESLLRRERAEVRLNEVGRFKAEAAMSPQVMADCRADCRAERLRAEAEVSFRRKRLEQVSADCAGDVQTIQACLDHIRKRHASGAMDKAHFTAAEREMARIQHDSARVHGLVARALMASNAEDVPYPSGSLLKRMVRPVAMGPATLGVDSWIAWGSALALGISVFLPLTSDYSPIGVFRSGAYQGQAVSWVLLIPILAGACATVIGSLPERMSRGLGLSLVWLALTLSGALLVHEAQFGIRPLAVWFRAGGPWFARSGILLLFLADLGILAAACLALAPLRTGRVALCIVGGTCLTFLLVVSTNFAGIFVPLPEIGVSWNAIENGPARADGHVAYDTSVTVHNAGLRALLLSPVPMDPRNSYQYLLESKTTQGSWQDAAESRAKDIREVPRGGNTVFRRELTPGNYRVRLISNAGGRVLEKSFMLPEPPPEIEPTAATAASEIPQPAVPAGQPPSAAAESEEAKPTSAATAPRRTAVTGPVPDVELRGIVRSEKYGPRFSVAVYPPNAPERDLDLKIGDTVYEPWKITEFNTERQAVTLSDGGHLLILNRGERIPLE